VWSTRGDRSSVWFHGLIEQGYAGLPGVALFDFGIPDGSDPTDLDVIAAHHPRSATRSSASSSRPSRSA
jgi:hypothetical protein